MPIKQYIKERIIALEKIKQDNRYTSNDIMFSNYGHACTAIAELQAVLSKMGEPGK